jgi:hypothetical protein
MAFGKPNFGLLMRGGAGAANPAQVAQVQQRQQGLVLDAQQLMNQREQAQLGAMMQGQQIQTAQEANQLKNRQYRDTLRQRDKEREQNKIMTQKKFEQDTYLRNQQFKQKQLEAQLQREAQEKQQAARAQASQQNIMLQAQANRELQERRIQAEQVKRQEKIVAKREEAQATAQIQQQTNEAIEKGDWDTVSKLVGPEKSLSLQKSKKTLTKQSAEDAKFTGNVTDVYRSLDTIDQLLADKSVGTGSLATLKYTPDVAQDIFLSGGQRKLKFSIDLATDAIGRLKSGGAINAGEEQRFLRFLPSAGDDLTTARFKMGELRKAMRSRLKAKGYSDEKIKELIGGAAGTKEGTPQAKQQQAQVKRKEIRQRREQNQQRLQVLDAELRRRGLIQ